MSTDAELNDLIKKFQSLQRSESTKKLNDRHVVEVLGLIQSHLGLDVVIASIGREYLTRAQVRKEVLDEVQLAGGRINVVDIPNLTHVDILHVERAVKELQQDDPSLIVQEGEIITQAYLDSTIHEAITTLKEAGCVSVSQFAKTHRLSSVYSERLLRAAINEGRIEATIQDGILYTATFVASQRRKMLCALLAVATPTPIAAIAKSRDIMPALTQRAADEAMTMCGLGGVGRLDGGLYTPTVFEQKREQSVKSTLAANGHISYKQLADNGIVGGRMFVAATFNPPPAEGATSTSGGKKAPKGRKGGKSAAANTEKNINAIATASDEYPYAGLALADGFIADRFFEGLAPVVEGVLEEDSGAAFVDLSAHLPFFVSLASQDGELVVARLLEHFPALVEHATISQNQHAFNKKAVEKAFANLKKDSICDIASALHKVTVALRGSDDLPEEVVAAALQQQIVDIVSANREAQAAKGQSSKATLRKTIARECAAMGTALCDLSRGTQWATTRLPEPTAITIHKHILATVGRPIIAYLLLDEAQENKGEMGEWASATQKEFPNVADIPPSNLAAAVKKLPKDKKATIGKLLELTQSGGKDGAEVFREAVADAQSSGEIPIMCIPVRNKKAEREAISAAGANILRQLKASPSFTSDKATSGPQKAATFSLLVSAVLYQQEKVVLILPGKAVGAVIPLMNHEKLTKHLPVITSLVLEKEVPIDALDELEALRKSVLGSE